MRPRIIVAVLAVLLASGAVSLADAQGPRAGTGRPPGSGLPPGRELPPLPAIVPADHGPARPVARSHAHPVPPGRPDWTPPGRIGQAGAPSGWTEGPTPPAPPNFPPPLPPGLRPRGEAGPLRLLSIPVDSPAESPDAQNGIGCQPDIYALAHRVGGWLYVDARHALVCWNFSAAVSRFNPWFVHHLFQYVETSTSQTTSITELLRDCGPQYQQEWSWSSCPTNWQPATEWIEAARWQRFRFDFHAASYGSGGQYHNSLYSDWYLGSQCCG